MTTESPKQRWPYGPVEVDADEIVLFGVGINEQAEEHTDPSRDDFRAPPMFCARVVIPASASALFDPSLQLDLRKIVHAGIELDFGAEVRPGDSLEAVATLLGIDSKPSGTLVRIGVDVTQQDGESVVSGETRYFIRGRKREGGAAREEPPGLPDGELLFDRDVATRDDQSLLYAEGSGDKFPIHIDDGFARSVGLPGVIMHGMCSLALSLRPVVAAAGGGRLARAACRFGSIALPGSPLAVRAVRDDSGLVRFEARDPQGKPVILQGELGLA